MNLLVELWVVFDVWVLLVIVCVVKFVINNLKLGYKINFVYDVLCMFDELLDWDVSVFFEVLGFGVLLLEDVNVCG